MFKPKFHAVCKQTGQIHVFHKILTEVKSVSEKIDIALDHRTINARKCVVCCH